MLLTQNCNVPRYPITKNEKVMMKQTPICKGIIGCLMYAMGCSILNLTHSLNVVTRFIGNPGKWHWEAVKWTMRYLKTSLCSTLVYGRKTPGDDFIQLILLDSNYATDVDKRSLQTRYVLLCNSVELECFSTHQLWYWQQQRLNKWLQKKLLRQPSGWRKL